MKSKTKIKRLAPRSGSALAAKLRVGGPMKQGRLKPESKQGAKNDQIEFLKEAEASKEDQCGTCKEPYSKIPTFRAMICSNSFHCCRDCVWENGKMINDCGDSHFNDDEEDDEREPYSFWTGEEHEIDL